MKRFNITINGDKWNVYLYADRDYKRLYSLNSDAITEYNHQKNLRQISFRKSKFCKSTALHEVMHAYLSYKDFSKLSYGKIEEQVCDVVGGKAHLITRVANTICSRA